MENEILLTSDISWVQHPVNQRYYFVEFKNRVVLLRINNFPDEPLYTLINGLDIMDIEDRPNGWSLG